MKIRRCVISHYRKHCPVSSSKCNNDSEIEFKIHRAVTLGQVIDIQNGGDTLIIRYYDLDFTIHKNKIMKMERNKNEKMVYIDSNLKRKYNQHVQTTASAWL